MNAEQKCQFYFWLHRIQWLKLSIHQRPTMGRGILKLCVVKDESDIGIQNLQRSPSACRIKKRRKVLCDIIESAANILLLSVKHTKKSNQLSIEKTSRNLIHHSNKLVNTSDDMATERTWLYHWKLYTNNGNSVDFKNSYQNEGT